MLQVNISDDISVGSVASELVVPLLAIIMIGKESLLLWDLFARSPPDLDAVKLICDLFIVVDAQENRFIVVDLICFETFSSIGGVTE